MDLYLPTAVTKPCPVVIWYGGLWKPTKGGVFSDTLLRHGCAIVCVESRTLEDGVADKIPAPIVYPMSDACRAVQFVRLHAAEWNLDPQKIAVAGSSQGTLPALYVGCSPDHANPNATNALDRVSTKVVGVGAWRSQPSIDPQQMQEWVPGVVWGPPALGCTFPESLARRSQLLPVIEKWSPEAQLNSTSAPTYFEYDWGLTKPEPFPLPDMDYKIHSPLWGLGFQKIARTKGATCYVKFPGRSSARYKDFWDFLLGVLGVQNT